MLRLRSWASSMISVSYARSCRSRWISASRMPSVITLMKVSLADPVGEPDCEPTGAAELGAELLGDALGHGSGREPARLGVADEALHAETELEAQLRELGALAGSGSPATTTTWWSRIAARSASRCATTGRSGYVGVGAARRRAIRSSSAALGHPATGLSLPVGRLGGRAPSRPS